LIDFIDKSVDLTNKSTKTRTSMETGLISAETGKGDQGLTRESKERTQVMSLEVPEERTQGMS
jgi:hypothetical protein